MLDLRKRSQRIGAFDHFPQPRVNEVRTCESDHPCACVSVSWNRAVERGFENQPRNPPAKRPNEGNQQTSQNPNQKSFPSTRLALGTKSGSNLIGRPLSFHRLIIYDSRVSARGHAENGRFNLDWLGEMILCSA